jgi:hypothetical protein
MKRAALILVAASITALPILVIAQSKSPRDSSAAKSLQRARVLQQETEKQKKDAERAKIAAEKAKSRADAEKHRTRVKALLAPGEWDVDELVDVDPIIEDALREVEPAMELARAALENINWGEINEAMQEASENLALIMPFPPLPDIPPMPDIPPIPALAPFPNIPPIPAIPPMPEILLGEGMRFEHGWSFNGKAYAKFLSDDEQVHLQALAALLDREEKTALPEIKTLARQHENWAMRAAAVAMLAKPESAEAIPILEEVLNKDTDPRVRKAAVRALSQRDEPAAREVLKRLLIK